MYLQQLPPIVQVGQKKNIEDSLTQYCLLDLDEEIRASVVNASKRITSAPNCPANIQRVIDKTPPFAGYRIAAGTPYEGATLTSATVRPANLFFNALLGPNSTTLPDSGELFAFRIPHADIKNQIDHADPNGVVAFSAKGILGQIYGRQIPDLSAVYGDATYRISNRELQETLASQKIYLSPQLPIPFYRALKHAMLQDGIVILPCHGRVPLKVQELWTLHCAALIAAVRARPNDYGFLSEQHCNETLDLSAYQLGSMVVKSEDFRIFMDANGKIIERNPGEQDAIRLINVCGIRDIYQTSPTIIDNKTIMTNTFKTSLAAAENGIVIFLAVGMGVWGGDPNLYWKAFLDAVIASADPIEQILVNPGHWASPSGPYQGCTGNEFQQILDEYRAQGVGLCNLDKIVNLYDQQTDVIHLAYQLKKEFPDKVISLFNASDPDVTLGYHVGEYVNDLSHSTTTEENYTAMGSNGLCFETITGVHNDPHRLIQVPFGPIQSNALHL